MHQWVATEDQAFNTSTTSAGADTSKDTHLGCPHVQVIDGVEGMILNMPAEG